MRISTGMMKLESIRNLTDVEKDLVDVQTRIARGVEVTKPSDDPLRYGISAKFKSSKKVHEQAVRTIGDAKRMTEINDNAVSRVMEVLQRTRILFLQGQNETLTTNDQKLIAKEMRQMLETLVQLANSGDIGRKLFGGTNTDADPFEVTRDSAGEITDVTYRGDRSALRRQIGENAEVDVNFVGSRIFQIFPDTAVSTFTSTSPGATFASQGLAAGDTTGFFTLQEKRVYFDTATDSLVDIRARINDKVPEVNASVTGSLLGTATVASASAASAATAGSITLNGQSISIAAGASLNTVVTAINNVAGSTGVTASAATVSGGFALQLDGGPEIVDTGLGTSNALTLLGATSGGASPTNLTSRNALSYRLQIQTDDPDLIFADDEGSGGFLRRLGIVDGSDATPANIPDAQRSGASLFQMYIDAVKNLDGGQNVSLQTTRMTEIDAAVRQFSDLRSDLAALTARIDESENREREFIIQNQTVIRDNEDLDLAVALSDLQRLQQKLQSAIGAAQNLPFKNLLSFI